MSIKARFGFALSYVADLEAATRFSVETLGLEVERMHPTFVQLRDQAGNGFALSSEQPLGDSRLELYWLVDDAERAARELAQTAEICLPLRAMPYGRVFGIRGPGGQPHYLVEFARDRPSQVVE
jgi:catechol 2,3-dioxygenase-like lactoylglutathione lyase family enzyme